MSTISAKTSSTTWRTTKTVRLLLLRIGRNLFLFSDENLYLDDAVIFDDFEFRIYNRWGEVIFTAYDPDFIWQGTNGLGELVQFGTYVWKARYRLADDIERVHVKERTGHINVIR